MDDNPECTNDKPYRDQQVSRVDHAHKSDAIESIQSDDTDTNAVLLPQDDEKGDIITPYKYQPTFKQKILKLSKTDRDNKLNSAINASYVGTIMFFLRAVFVFQPYSQLLSNYIKNSSSYFKQFFFLFLAGSIIVSIVYLFKSCKTDSSAKSISLSSRLFLYIALITTLLSEVALGVSMFIHQVVQLIAPGLFLTSNFIFILSTCYNHEKCSYKIFFSLCFFICMLGSIIVLLNTLDIDISNFSSCRWSHHLPIITLTASTICATIITLRHFICECMQNRHHNIQQHHLNNNQADETIEEKFCSSILSDDILEPMTEENPKSALENQNVNRLIL